MPLFQFEAMDESGIEISDRIEADDEADAKRQLRDRGLFVTRLRQIGSAPDTQMGRDASADDSPKRPGSSTTSGLQKTPRWFWYVWSSLFLGLGCIFLFFLGILPLIRVARATGWVETPCTVVSSELKMHPSTDSESPGPTYSVQIAYRYEYAGKTYQSKRYDFVQMSSNTSMAKKRRLVKAHPPGTQAVCFVNPDDPNEAVLERGPTSEMWWGLFPIPFVVIGALGFLFGVGLWRFIKRPHEG